MGAVSCYNEHVITFEFVSEFAFVSAFAFVSCCIRFFHLPVGVHAIRELYCFAGKWKNRIQQDTNADTNANSETNPNVITCSM